MVLCCVFLSLYLFCADGILLKEVDRLLRSNGYFVYSAPPAYRKDKDFPIIWEKLVNLTSAMCWKLIAKRVQTAIWMKQEDPACLQHISEQKLIDICDAADDSKSSWNTKLGNCIQVRGMQTNAPKLPSKPDRLSIYSESLKKIGSLLLLFDSLLFTFPIYCL